MKILVVSDSHGDYNVISRLIRSQTKAEVIIFLGDGYEEFQDLRLDFPQKMFYGVRGNNDWSCPLPLNDEITLEGKKIFFTHGHREHVKYGLDVLKTAARQRHADIVLFGHTHEPYTEYDNGLYIMNPGCIHRTCCSYGVIDNKKNGILMNTAYVK